MEVINNNLASDKPHPVIKLCGGPTSGKSTVLALIYDKCTKHSNASDYSVIVRKIGSTVRSSSLCELLRSIVHQMRLCLNISTIPMNVEYTVSWLREYMDELFSLSIKWGSVIVILLDDIDLLNAKEEEWLQLNLPPNVHIICSTSSESGASSSASDTKTVEAKSIIILTQEAHQPSEDMNQVFRDLDHEFGHEVMRAISGVLSSTLFGVTELELFDLLSLMDDIYNTEKLDFPVKFTFTTWLTLKSKLSKFTSNQP